MMLDKKELEFLIVFGRLHPIDRDVTSALVILDNKTLQTGYVWLNVLVRKGALSVARSQARRKNIYSLTPAAEQELAENFPEEQPTPQEVADGAGQNNHGPN